MKKKLVSALLVAAMATSLVACGGKEDTNSQAGKNEGKDTQSEVSKDDALKALIEATKDPVDLTVWCSEQENWQTEMKKITEDFKALYPDVTFNFTIGAESEANAKDDLLKDPEAGGDVFVFADDQITELAKAKILQEVTTTYTYDMAENYEEDAMNAASVDGKQYAYPLTTNGYFLFYNKDFVSDEQAGSWEGLLEAAKACDGVIGMDMGNAWYVYGWFAGAGLTCTFADDGASNVCDWNSTTNTPTGAAVGKYIMDLSANPEFQSIGDGDSRTLKITIDGKEKNIIGYVDGLWAANDYTKAIGDKLGAAKLPTFNIDGKDYQMGGFKGYKMVGVNAYSKNPGWSMIFAEYLTSAKTQAEIYETLGEGPANKNTASVANSPAIAGSMAQLPYSDFQRVGGNFWTPGASLGTTLYEGTKDIQKALDDAVTGITAPAQ